MDYPTTENSVWKILKDDLEAKVLNRLQMISIHPKETNSRSECSENSERNLPREFLEQRLASLEDSKYCLTFTSGCAAVNATMQTILSSGSHIVAMKTIYAGTVTVIKSFEKFGISVDFIDDFVEPTQQILALVNKNTKMVWLESPANPTLQIVDIEEIARNAKKIFPEILIVVDNTFLTPIFQRPLELGADISLHSCSKYLSGHQDLFMGSISTNSDKLYNKLFKIRGATGTGNLSPFECQMVIQSLRTLPIRMKSHSQTALQVALFLEAHPAVVKVIHPGLASHPQHNLAKKQQFGHSGALGFYLNGGLDESNTFMRNLKVILRAPSLGADFSIANLPSKRSHSELPRSIREQLGITDSYIRLSVGLENVDSLTSDLNQALSNLLTN